MQLLIEDKTHIFREEEGIICLEYKTNIVDIHAARAGVANRIKLSNHKPCLLFADLRGVVEVTKSAREFYASKEAGELLMASAILAPSPLNKTLSSFFINFNRPAVPMEWFNSKEKAFEWLHEYAQKHSLNK